MTQIIRSMGATQVGPLHRGEATRRAVDALAVRAIRLARSGTSSAVDAAEELVDAAESSTLLLSVALARVDRSAVADRSLVAARAAELLRAARDQAASLAS